MPATTPYRAPGPRRDPATGEVYIHTLPHRHRHYLPDNAMYGHAQRLAATLQAPLGWAYTSLLALYAGMGVQKQDKTRIIPRLYVVLIGAPGAGKSYTIERAIEASRIKPTRFSRAAIVSDRGLVKEFADQAFPDPKVVIQDEMRMLMKKISIQNSALSNVLNTAYYQDGIEITDKSGKHIAPVRLSLLGGLTARSPEEFAQAFGHETLDGFLTRCLLVPGPDSWEWDHEWQAEYVAAPTLNRGIETVDLSGLGDQPLSSTPRVPGHIFEAERTWRAGNPSRGRLGELALRVALITAAINNDVEVTREGMEAALRFAEWQEKVRAEYLPETGMNDDAIVSNRIMQAFADWEAKHPREYATFSAIARKKNWYRDYGASLANRAKRALIHDGMLEREGMYNDKTQQMEYGENPRLRISVEQSNLVQVRTA